MNSIESYAASDGWAVVERKKPRTQNNTPVLQNTAVSPTREQKRAMLASRVETYYQEARSRHPEPTLENGAVVEFSDKQISTIRFSQDSIGSRTTNGMRLEDLTDNMRSRGWNDRFSIDVVKMPDDLYTSLDNRRLHCAREVIETPVYGGGKVSVARYDSLTITARTYHHSIRANGRDTNAMRSSYRNAMIDLYPDHYADIRFNKIPLPRTEGIQSNTWGELVTLRLNSGEGNTDSYPYGFHKTYVRG